MKTFKINWIETREFECVAYINAETLKEVDDKFYLNDIYNQTEVEIDGSTVFIKIDQIKEEK